jgi:gliding motility-associated-like protein
MSISKPKKSLAFLILILHSLFGFSQPSIQSFAPASGTIGSTILIKGTGFSTTAINNIVYFGAVRAKVISSTLTSLDVTVPEGTSYEPITVTVDNLIAYSNSPFVVTFPGANTDIFPRDIYNKRIDAPVAYEDPDYGESYEFCNVDLDGDGKPDMVSANTSANSISVVRNTSIVGKISFEKNKDYPTDAGPVGISYGDFDGDGKQDIVIVNTSAKIISVYRNLSTIGNIALASKIDFDLDNYYTSVAVGDIDKDGKTDLAISGAVNNIVIFRNSSSAGNISFETALEFPVGYGFMDKINIRDLDGDGIPEIIRNLNGSFQGYRIAILKNRSTPGNITMDKPLLLPSGNGPNDIAIGDLNQDGLPEIISADNQNYTFSVLKNKSASGVISFDEYITFHVGRFPQYIAIGDMDGDNKPDVAVSNNEHYGYTVSIFKNISSTNSIQFAQKIDLTTLGGPEKVAVEDIDGDGKPEIEVIGGDASVISVFTHCPTATIIEQPVDSTICVSGNASFSVTTLDTAAGYSWQADTGYGWTDLPNNSTYRGVNTNNLKVNGVTISMNGYQYRCLVISRCETDTTSIAKLIVNTLSPPIIKIIATDTFICKSTSVKFIATTTNGGANAIYQWKKNNLNVGINTNFYEDSSFVDGDIISCVITSNAKCLTTPINTSNIVTMHVTDQLTPLISVTASSNRICPNIKVIFNATVINGGDGLYQWKKNRNFVGINSSVYIDSSLKNNDTISCIFMPRLSCSTLNATSNDIIIGVDSVITPTIYITASGNNICPGEKVNFVATAFDQGPLPFYQWTKNDTAFGINSANYFANNLIDGDKISCILTSNAQGCLSSKTIISNTIQININKNLPGKVNLGNDRSFCAGNNITINSPTGYASYEWQDNSTNSFIIVNKPGLYIVKAKDACNIISSDTILITQNDIPEAFLPRDTSVCVYDKIKIQANKSFVNYLWNNNTSTSFINVTAPGIYWLKVTDFNGCSGEDSILVTTKDCMHGVYVPSAFSPNGDGKNDIFKPLVFGQLLNYNFQVFDRYGQMIFHSYDASKGWDGLVKGKKQNSNVFVWMCTYQLQDEKTTKKTGTVTLIK